MSTTRATQERLRELSADRTRLLELLIQQRQNPEQELRPCQRASGGGEYFLPTSWAQQRLWFIYQLEGASSAYNIPLVARLRGELDEGALRRALDELVQRHEVLRTTFVNVEGEPKQRIAEHGSFELRLLDLSDEDRERREARLRQCELEETRVAFDLSTGPLIRGRLVRLAHDEHVLLITIHHIVADGWSLGVMIRELVELYGASRQGRDNPLPPLAIQYADYAHWQRQWLQGQRLERQLSYWRSRLEGAVPHLQLPTDRPRPAVQAYRGRTLPVALDERLSADLNALARRYGMTLFMVLYAGWAILLSRLSGEEDIVIGTPVANRRRPELEHLIGFFVNTLALRVRVDGDATVESFLEQVKAVTLGAYDHQDVPFEHLVEVLRPERSLNRHPIFQVMYVLQNAPRSELTLPGLAVTLEEGVNETSKFDLLLSLEERGNRIEGTLCYDIDLFERDTVERWLACLMVLLRDMTRAPGRRIADLSILPEAERVKVIDRFGATQAYYRGERLIHRLFEAQARRTPDALALKHGEATLTYAALNASANRLARELQNRGVGPDQLVGICVERSLEMVIGLLGILKAGGAYIPLDPNYPPERLQYMLSDANPRLVLTQRGLPLVPTGGPVLLLDEILEQAAAHSAENIGDDESRQAAGQLAYVIYTSGSTGRPKGTAMPHDALSNLIEWHRASFEPGSCRVLQFAALSFDVAFQETFTTLCTGGTLVLIDESVRRDPPALLELLRREGVERLFVPPLMLQNLAECARSLEGAAPDRLREIIVAGEQLRISPEIVEFFRQRPACRLANHYGPTETHVVTALTLPEDAREWPNLPSIGLPIANVRIYILDRLRRPVPIGVVGEIYIAGANVARGYHKQPRLTAERFLADPFAPAAPSRMYKTGDLGRWRSDGTIEYLGRNDDQVKIRGYRIELGEIEAQLALHERVKEAAVALRQDPGGGKRLVAYVTLHGQREGRGAIADDLRAHLKSLLPEYMVPAAFVMLERLPTTPSGKLDRRALPAPDACDYAVKVGEAPQGELEQTIARIWQELLHVGNVSRSDNFFELGGHSLLVLKILFRVNEACGSSLTVTDVYKNPTVQQLAQRVRGAAAADEPVDLAREAELDPAVVALPERPCTPARTILLTGATGFVGRFLLAHLLEHSDATIHCLVRAASQSEALGRLRATLSKWDLWDDAYERRIVAVAGDMRLPHLGIEPSTYRSLCRTVDSIFHCATSMNHLETYTMAKAANVDASKEIVRFAASERPKLVNYISTLGIFASGQRPGRVVSELTPIEDESFRHSQGYLASKWVGERIFMTAAERGIACNIFRVGLVWADSRRGRFDELQHVYRVLKTCLLAGCGIERFRYGMPPTPVDYVARAVTFLADRRSHGKGIFHISSSDQLVDGVFELCARLTGLPLTLMPYYDWICAIKRLHLQGRSLPAVPLLEYAFSMDEPTFHEHELRRRMAQDIHLDLARTHGELEDAGIVAPMLDEDLLAICLHDMLERDPDLRELADRYRNSTRRHDTRRGTTDAVPAA